MLPNFVFLVHAAVALILALLLFFFPEWFTQMATGVTLAPGAMADVAVVFARYAAMGLLLIVLGTSFARTSASTRARWVVVWSMGMISVVGVLVSLMVPFYPMQIVGVVLNAIFVLAYWWVWVFKANEI